MTDIDGIKLYIFQPATGHTKPIAIKQAFKQSMNQSSNQPMTEPINQTSSANNQSTNASIRRSAVLFACAALRQLRASGRIRKACSASQQTAKTKEYEAGALPGVFRPHVRELVRKWDPVTLVVGSNDDCSLSARFVPKRDVLSAVKGRVLFVTKSRSVSTVRRNFQARKAPATSALPVEDTLSPGCQIQ